MFCSESIALGWKTHPGPSKARRCLLSYLICEYGMVNDICMLHWCSNNSLNASSAGTSCDCMVEGKTSVTDDISLGLLCSGWLAGKKQKESNSTSLHLYNFTLTWKRHAQISQLTFYTHQQDPAHVCVCVAVCLSNCMCACTVVPRVCWRCICCALWQWYVKYLILQS